jgi:serine/threonine-protein kinase HipA
MRQSVILYKDEEAGILTQHNDGSFTFCYNDTWIANSKNPYISLTLPKTKQEYHSKYMFPFFFQYASRRFE